MNKQISKRTLNRLPIYLSLLQEKAREGVEYISATTIANLLDLNHVQVRKDLSCASSAGRPKVGYETQVLIKDLQEFLDYNNSKKAVIVGAGDLGKAMNDLIARGYIVRKVEYIKGSKMVSLRADFKKLENDGLWVNGD